MVDGKKVIDLQDYKDLVESTMDTAYENFIDIFNLVLVKGPFLKRRIQFPKDPEKAKKIEERVEEVKKLAETFENINPPKGVEKQHRVILSFLNRLANISSSFEDPDKELTQQEKAEKKAKDKELKKLSFETLKAVAQVKNTFSIGEDTLMIKPSFKLGILNKFIKFDDVEDEPDNTEEIER